MKTIVLLYIVGFYSSVFLSETRIVILLKYCTCHQEGDLKTHVLFYHNKLLQTRETNSMYSINEDNCFIVDI